MLQRASKKLILVFIFALIALVTTYSYISLNTIGLSEDDIARDIEKRGTSSVEIILMTDSRDEQFILFSNDTSGQLGMIYYEPQPLIPTRYKFLGGSNIEGKADTYHEYGVHNFGQTAEKGWERLIVVYGRNEPNANRLELDLGDRTVIRNIDGKNYFLEVVRFEQEKWGNPNIRFFDSDGKDITEKFY